MNQKNIDEIRSFNRYYTSILGVLNRNLLNSEYTLPEGRVLLELYHHQISSPLQIAASLKLDKGYLSRILKKFKQLELTVQTQSDSDGRAQFLSLTEKGTQAYLKLNAETDEHINQMFGNLSSSEIDQITACMKTIMTITSKADGSN